MGESPISAWWGRLLQRAVVVANVTLRYFGSALHCVSSPAMLARPLPTARRPLLLAALLLLAPSWSAAQGVDSLTEEQKQEIIASIREAWQQRARSTRTFHFEWMATMTWTAAAVADSPSRLHARERGQHEDPPGDHVLRDVREVLIVDGEKARYETTSISLAAGKEGHPQPMLSAFDGVLRQSFQPEAAVDYDQGVIGGAAASDHWTQAHLSALTLAFRPHLSPLPELNATNFSLVSIDAEWDGVPCFVIDERPGVREGGVHDTLWIDARSNLPVRWESDVSGQRSFEAEIQYAPDAEVGFVPSWWRVTSYLTPDGSMSQRVEGSVVEYSINEDIPEETFRIEFPAGTRVIDRRQGEMEYVVTAQGALAPYLPPARDQAFPWVRYLLLAGSVAVIAALFLVWRQRTSS